MDERNNMRFSTYAEGKHPLCTIMRRKLTLRIAGAVLWFAGWVTACTLWGRDHTELLSFPNWVLLGVLIGLCGVWGFGVVQLLLDRPFEGTIVGMTQRRVWHREWLFAKRIAQELQITAMVEVDGKTVRFRFPIKAIEPKEYYLIGDRVRHYRGLPFLEREDKSDDDTICLVCGKFTYVEDGRCEYCGSPLVW